MKLCATFLVTSIYIRNVYIDFQPQEYHLEYLNNVIYYEA